MVAAARELLARAEGGNISGLVYIASSSANDHDWGMIGTYADSPPAGVHAITRLLYELSRRNAKAEGDISMFGALE